MEDSEIQEWESESEKIIQITDLMAPHIVGIMLLYTTASLGHLPPGVKPNPDVGCACGWSITASTTVQPLMLAAQHLLVVNVGVPEPDSV